MAELEKLEALLCAEEGAEQGLALVETLRDEVPWEQLLVRVTVHGPPFDRYPVGDEDKAGFRDVFRLTLGRFEPIMKGVYRPQRTAERINLVLRLLALAPEVGVRLERGVCIHGNDGVIDGSALADAFPHLESLMLVHCEVDGWDELSRMQLEELRLYRCRSFHATAPFTCTRLGVAETSIQDGRSFGSVEHLTTRGGMQPQALRAFRRLKSIRCLGGSGCTNDLLVAMASLPELEVVDVEWTARSTRRAPGPVQYVNADLAPFADTPKLRVLKLMRTHIDPHRLHALLGHPTLESIDLDPKWKGRIPKQVRRKLPLK